MPNAPTPNTDSISEENKLLRQRCANMEEEIERLRQESHLATTKLQVALKTNNDLSYEIENVTSESTKQIDLLRQKHDYIMKEQQRNAKEAILRIEHQRECLSANMATQSVRLKLTEQHVSAKPITLDRADREHEQSIKEIDLLKHKLNRSDLSLYQAQQEIVRLSEELSILHEEYDVAMHNLTCKKKEIEELTNMLESAQGQSALLTAEIAEMHSSSENTNKKGNSLFVEVADQRKKLMNIIVDLKGRYNLLRNEHRNCPLQLRTLSRKQHEVATQCGQYMVKLYSAENSNIKALREQTNDMTIELKRARLRISYLEAEAASRSAAWSISLVEYYRSEITALETRLSSSQLKHRQTEEELWTTTKELAMLGIEANKQKLDTCQQQMESASTMCSVKPSETIAISEESDLCGAESIHLSEDLKSIPAKVDIVTVNEEINGQKKAVMNIVYKPIQNKCYKIQDLMKATAERKLALAANNTVQASDIAKDNGLQNAHDHAGMEWIALKKLAEVQLGLHVEVDGEMVKDNKKSTSQPRRTD